MKNFFFAICIGIVKKVCKISERETHHEINNDYPDFVPIQKLEGLLVAHTCPIKINKTLNPQKVRFSPV